jgi:hypothetical protein
MTLSTVLLPLQASLLLPLVTRPSLIMASTYSTEKDFTSIESIEAYFTNQILAANSKLDRYVAKIIELGSDRDYDNGSYDGETPQRKVERLQKEQIRRLCRHLGQWEKERLTELDRRNERMRILRDEIEDLSDMKEREVHRFYGRRPLTRNNLSSHEDIEEFYSKDSCSGDSEESLGARGVGTGNGDALV